MVLSLAFILAFIGAAVALLIGIIIFSDIAEAMALTLPVQVIGDDTPATVDNTWGLREHDVSAVALEDPSVDFFLQKDPTTNNRSVLWIDHDPASSFGNAYVMKTFNKEDIIDRQISLEWLLNISGGKSIISIYDGAYDHTSLADFPNASTITLKGGGLCDQIIINNSLATFQIATLNINLACSTLPQVTIIVYAEDQNRFTFTATKVDYIEISGLKRWDFDCNFINPANCSGAGTTVFYTATGSLDDNGTVDATLIDPVNATQPQVLIPFTEGEQQQVDTFNNALNIGFTVLGILPVALFFFLFMIFGGRVE